MLTIAVVIFGMAALGGFVLASNVLRKRFAPWAISAGHALLGVSGLGVLAVVVVEGGASTGATAALVLLAIAALGGFYLASLHRRGTLAPRTIVYVHAAVALLGVLILFGAVMS